MPTPAKSWIMQLRRQKQTANVQWVSWIPLKRCWRSAWLPWLWGQVRWWGQGPPWERVPTVCRSCGLKHGSSVALVGRFSGPGGRHWLRTASEHDRWLCARLLIPHSLLDTIPRRERCRLRSVAGLFQFPAIQGVQGVRQKRAAPKPDLQPSPLWITRFTAHHYIPRETPQNLRNMVGAPTGQTRKHKRSTPHDQLIIGMDTWLQEARRANGLNAVQWFTRTILHQATTVTQQGKRPTTLNALHNCWTTTLECMEDLTRKHLRATTHAYNCATTCAHAMKHLRHHRSMYDSAITAKRCYHDVVAARLRDKISIIRTHPPTRGGHDT